MERDYDKIPKPLPNKKINYLDNILTIVFCIISIIIIIVTSIGLIRATYIAIENIEYQDKICSNYKGVNSYALLSISTYFECKDGSSFNLIKKRE